jgi:hypothetical protein
MTNSCVQNVWLISALGVRSWTLDVLSFER